MRRAAQASGWMSPTLILLACLAVGTTLLTPPVWTQTPPAADLTGSEPQVQKKIEGARARVESEPDSSAAWGRYAMILEAHRHTEEAQLAYRRASALDPKEVRWPYLLGAMLEYFDPEESYSWHRKALAIDDSYAPGQYRVGQTLEKLGRLDEAREHYARAVTLKPGFGLAHFALGRLALGRGEDSEAVEHLETAYGHSPDVQAVVATLARAYRRVGRNELARTRAAESRDLPRMTHHPDPLRAAMMEEAVSTESFLRRSRTYLEVGQLERSLKVLGTLLEMQPNNHEAHFAAGRRARQARASRAGGAVGTTGSGTRARSSGCPRAVLAGALFKLGDFDAARVESRSVLKSEPQNFHVLLISSMLGCAEW